MIIGDNMRGVHLQGCKKKLPVLKNYLNPNKIYIPLSSEIDYIVYVKKNDYVYKGTLLAKTKGTLVKKLFSSVSGFVEDIILKGDNKYIVINNDFKEKIEQKVNPKKEIQKITKEKFITTLKDTGIIGMGGAGFPTYKKYEAENLKTLIVNAVECEPFITSDYCLLKEKAEEILLCMDVIMEINQLEEAYIAIKSNNKELKKIIQAYLGTYVKIKLVCVPNLYPMGWEKNLVRYIKKVTYQKLPCEKGIVVNNVSTIYAIYQALKFEKPLIERMITITGNMVKNPCNMLVKVGTRVEEILSQVSLKRKEDITIYLGGPMMGQPATLYSSIMGSTNAIMIDAYKEEKENKCLRCSKCVQYCPAFLEPVLIKNAKIEEVKKYHPEKCIECGICSYVCPAHIQLREKVKEAKKER